MSDQDVSDKIFLGAEVERFLGTTLAKHLMKILEDQLEATMLEFSYVNPTDVRAVTDIQIRYRMAHSFPSWLADALTEADEAVRVLEQQNFTD